MTTILSPVSTRATPAHDATPGAAQRRLAQEFEAQILGAMLQPMFEGARPGAFGGGAGEATWQPMLVTEYGKAFARAGGIGLADQVLRALRPASHGGDGA